MKVIVNTINGPHDERLKLEVEYYRQFCLNMAKNHEVVLLYADPLFALENENLKQVKIEPATQNAIKFYYWFSTEIKKLVRQEGVELLISIGIPLGKIPITYNLIEDGSSKVQKKGRFSESLLTKSREKANKIFGLGYENLAADPQLPLLKPAPYSIDDGLIDKREEIKEKVADGKEYFLYYGYLDESPFIVNLLKAYSSFKKRQRSSMKLVLAGKKAGNPAALEKLISTFRFKADVVLLEEQQLDLPELFSGSYAVVLGNEKLTHFSALILAMQLHTPAFIPENSFSKEIPPREVVTFEAGNFEDLGLKMIRMFQDEKARSNQVREAAKTAAGLTWQDMIEKTTALP